MFSLRRPSDLALTAFRLRQGRLALTDPHPGCTFAAACPPGYDVDHTRALLGTGPDVYHAAREAVWNWEQFPPAWVAVHPPRAPAAVGTVVVVLARVFGVWVRNACRVIEMTDEAGRFGLAYGTLPGHIEQGEERFTVEMIADGTVWYDILAYSLPRHPLARVGYPVVRRVQWRFARDSVAAMRRAIAVRTGTVAAEPA
jgi:uncharacterized protein (UPF0548 family)